MFVSVFIRKSSKINFSFSSIKIKRVKPAKKIIIAAMILKILRSLNKKKRNTGKMNAAERWT